MKKIKLYHILLFIAGIIGGHIIAGKKVEKLEDEIEKTLKEKDDLIEESLKQTEDAIELAKKVKEMNDELRDTMSNRS